MTYSEIGRFAKALQEADKTFMLKASIVLAVQHYMDVSAYDDEGFGQICDNFFTAIIDAFIGWPEFGNVAFRAQMLIATGKCETPSVECFKEALKLEGYQI